MKSLKEYVLDAEKKGIAIGHFNISNLEGLRGIFNAARVLDLPVIIGTAEGERSFIGTKQAVALVKSLREEYKNTAGDPYPIFLNADHCYSFEKVKEAVDAGYDAVIFDATDLSFEENIKVTKKCVEYARSVNPNILVESELGFIGKSSQVHSGIPEGVKITDEFLTKAEEAKQFVEATGVDMLAPAIGNIHGMLKGGKDPALNIERIAEIKKAVKIPMVLHGASGNSPEDVRAAISAGMSIVHVNTELRVAFRKALVKSLQENPDEVAPYKYMKDSVKAVAEVVESKLRLFNNL
jgi:fructose-bisphosphate aldolase class II